MADKVFINGRAAVHKGSKGKSIAFPDVCLCPPTPPAGPVPTPLPNSVKAADLAGTATSVVIEGNPAAHRASYFQRSTGNEASRPTGGGVVTHGVQGKAHWGSHSMNVFFEGEPAVRHMDLLTHNHVAQPGNTPPAPWISSLNAPPVAPKSLARNAGEGTDWIDLRFVYEHGGPAASLRYEIKSPSGTILDGALGAHAVIRIIGLKKGKCQLLLESPTTPVKTRRRAGAEPKEDRGEPRKPAEIARSPDGSWPVTSLGTGAAYEVVLKRPTRTLELERRYHDDRPVRGAPFEVLEADGGIIEGELDASGRATVEHVLDGEVKVRFGPDERDYQPVEQGRNPEYRESFSQMDADALIENARRS